MNMATRTLVIDTASEACSVALFEGQEALASDHRVMGRGHAERLIPMIEALPEKGRADRILASLGPGSFTGVRIGIAAARALGVAWGSKVLGYPTLAVVAAQIAPDSAANGVTVCMNGGHGEWFIQSFQDGKPVDALRSLLPEAAKATGPCGVIAGNRGHEFARLLGDKRTALDLLPNASAAMLLDEGLLTQDLSPIYGRAPDAKPQANPKISGTQA